MTIEKKNLLAVPITVILVCAFGVTSASAAKPETLTPIPSTGTNYSAPQSSTQSAASGVARATLTPEVQPTGTQGENLTGSLNFLMTIPSSVLAQGDDATAAWLIESAAGAEGDPMLRANIFACSGSIALAIAGLAFPAAKLLKIQGLIAQLGGVTKAVQTFWGASFNYEKIQALGGAVAALGAELLGIAAIQESCFE